MKNSKLLHFLVLTIVLSACAGCQASKKDPESMRNDLIWAIPPSFQETNGYASGLATAKLPGGSYAFIDKKGNTKWEKTFLAVNARWSQSYLTPDFSYGITEVTSEESDAICLFTRSGKLVEGTYPEIQNMMATNATSLFPSQDPSTEKYGYVNQQKLWYIPPYYYEADEFGEHVSIASADDGTFIVDALGGAISPFTYEVSGSKFSHGLSAGHWDEGRCYVNRQGERVIFGPFEKAADFCENYAAVKKDGLWGYIDTKGSWLVKPQYSEAHDFSEGYAAVCDEKNRWGFIDSEGRQVIPFRFQAADIGAFCGGVCAVSAPSSERYGIIDKTGKWVVPPKYEMVITQKTYAKLKSGGKLGLYFPKTGALLQPQFDDVERVSDSLLVASKGNTCDVLLFPETGEVSSRKYYHISFFSEGLAAAKKTAFGQWGFIDGRGDWVIQPQFDDAYPFHEGLAAVKADNQWGYIANPLVYTSWEPDEAKRASLMGLQLPSGNSSSEEAITFDDFTALSAQFLRLKSGQLASSADVLELLGLPQNHTNSDIITREEASKTLAMLADHFGTNIYCLFAFLEDEDSVDPQYLQFVSFSASYGLMDLPAPGRFNPKGNITNREATVMMLRLFECLIDG